MARVANMSMALFEGLMEYFREVYDLEEPAPMVARLLRGHDRRNVAFVVQHGRNLNKSSPARAALDLFAKGNSPKSVASKAPHKGRKGRYQHAGGGVGGR